MTLVWYKDPESTKNYWETSWVRWLFKDVSSSELVDTNLNSYVDKAIIIVHQLRDYQNLFKEYERRDIKYGIVHLGDETATYGKSEYYPDSASFILRNYYVPELALDSRINFFPLGYKAKFWEGYSGLPVEELKPRPLVWSWAGDVNKSDRVDMLNCMFKLKSPHRVTIINGWDSPNSLPTSAYRDLLLQSTFIPSPNGNISVDTFRTIEALDTGCIPIISYQSQQNIPDYYRKLVNACGFTEPVPFPIINSWSEVEQLMPIWLEQNKEGVFGNKCYKWWLNWKNHTKTQVEKLVTYLN
jgi:hypothetical protein